MSHANFFEGVAERIRELRGEMAQVAFAERLGVDRKSVAGWEAGKRLPDGASLLALATVFGADVHYLLTGERSSEGNGLTARERTLLDNYVAADEAGRRLIEGTADLAAKPKAVSGSKRAA